MAKSLAYNFCLNMWIMGRVDETYLKKQVTVGRLTKEEYDMIVVTPQNKQ